MGSWKKIITSGSDADLNNITISGTADFSEASVTGIDTNVDLDNVSNITPNDDNVDPNGNTGIDIGTADRKFDNIFAVNTFFGGIHEINLGQEGLNKIQEGTVLSIKNGALHPCEKEADPLVTAIASKNQNYPIVLGAEPVLVTGKIKVGDFIITSKIKGHGKGINPKYIYDKQLFGKVIAQAMEDGKGKSYLVKAMIRKCRLWQKNFMH